MIYFSIEIKNIPLEIQAVFLLKKEPSEIGNLAGYPVAHYSITPLLHHSI